MLELSRKSDYALRAVIFLARLSPERYGRVSEIAKARNIPQAFLAQILPLLANRGVVRSQQGAQGGYALARKPSEVTFLEVIEAVEGPLRLNKCTGEQHEDCSLQESCEMHAVWNRAQKQTVDFLHNVTMADMLKARHHHQSSDISRQSSAKRIT
jgi:Rrf2 family protein